MNIIEGKITPPFQHVIVMYRKKQFRASFFQGAPPRENKSSNLHVLGKKENGASNALRSDWLKYTLLKKAIIILRASFTFWARKMNKQGWQNWLSTRAVWGFTLDNWLRNRRFDSESLIGLPFLLCTCVLHDSTCFIDHHFFYSYSAITWATLSMSQVSSFRQFVSVFFKA